MEIVPRRFLRFRMDLYSDSPKEVSGESLKPQLTNMVKS